MTAETIEWTAITEQPQGGDSGWQGDLIFTNGGDQDNDLSAVLSGL